MHRIGTVAAIAALVFGSACGDHVTQPVASDAQLRLINAAGVPLDISVDGAATLTGAAPTSISAVLLDAGTHGVTVTAGSGAAVTVSVDATPAGITTAYVYAPTPGALAAATLDTGSIVAAGRSKVRVVNLSPSADTLAIWRTQPDFASPVRIMTPFPYLASSPYLESSMGDWEVFVSPRGDSATKVATTGPFSLASGGRATVVLLDSAGTLVTRISRE